MSENRNEDSRSVRGIFDPESPDNTASAEKMNEYIRVSTPRAWIVFAALALILGGLLFWGLFGRIPVNRSFTGIAVISDYTDYASFETALGDTEYLVDQVICLPEAMDISPMELEGSEAIITFHDGRRVKAAGVHVNPNVLDDEDVDQLLQSLDVDTAWTMYQMGGGVYHYLVKIDLAEKISYLYWTDTCNVEAVVDQVQPISFLFN